MMENSPYVYFLFVTLMAVVFLGIIIYYYSPKRKKKVEDPKYRMLEGDD